MKIPDRPVPGEMEILEKFVGAWRTRSTNKVCEWNPTEFESTGEARGKLILGGQFLQLENSEEGGEPYGITIYTYDSAQKQYRSWIFDALGNAVESTGEWEPEIQTLTFIPKGKSGKGLFTFRFIDESTIEYTIVGKDEAGKLLLDVCGTWVRQG